MNDKISLEKNVRIREDRKAKKGVLGGGWGWVRVLMIGGMGEGFDDREDGWGFWW